MNGEITADSNRFDRFVAELRYALGQFSKDELKDWGIASAKTFGNGSVRRIKGLGQLAMRIGIWTFAESRDAYTAYQRENLKNHVQQRGKALIETGKDVAAYAQQTATDYYELIAKFTDSPAEVGPILAGQVIGFLVGSGGLDGDGGIPDMDLLGGPGGHRSILTHSLIAGAAAETVIFAFLNLTMRAYNRLPESHDPAWDVMARMAPSFAENLRKGTDAGIAFHLAWDSTVDGMTPYKDLPIGGLPMEGHKAILAVNSAAEAKSAMDKREPKKKAKGQE